jgi:hypothetical protein
MEFGVSVMITAGAHAAERIKIYLLRTRRRSAERNHWFLSACFLSSISFSREKEMDTVTPHPRLIIAGKQRFPALTNLGIGYWDAFVLSCS